MVSRTRSLASGASEGRNGGTGECRDHREGRAADCRRDAVSVIESVAVDHAQIKGVCSHRDAGMYDRSRNSSYPCSPREHLSEDRVLVIERAWDLGRQKLTPVRTAGSGPPGPRASWRTEMNRPRLRRAHIDRTNMARAKRPANDKIAAYVVSHSEWKA